MRKYSETANDGFNNIHNKFNHSLVYYDGRNKSVLNENGTFRHIQKQDGCAYNKAQKR